MANKKLVLSQIEPVYVPTPDTKEDERTQVNPIDKGPNGIMTTVI